MEKDRTISLFGLIATALASFFVLYILGGIAAFYIAEIIGRESVICQYIVLHTPYILLFLFLLAAPPVMLNTSLFGLSTPQHPIRWKLFFSSAVISIGVYILFSLFSMDRIRVLETEWQTRVLLLIPVLILTPLQAFSEEILFRVIPYHAVIRNGRTGIVRISIYALISALIFALPHIPNNEIQQASSYLPLLYYFLWGFLAAITAVLSGGFEVPIAMHVTNNLYIVLAVNYEGSSLPSLPLFMAEKPTAAASIAETAVLYTVMISLLAATGYIGRRRKP